MKKIVYSILAVLSAAMFVLSCAKEEPQIEGGIQVTLNAGKPLVEAFLTTKTEMYGGSPYWSVGDRLGVSNGTTSNSVFTTSIADRAVTAEFTGTVEAAGDYYAYYPYTTNGVGTVSEKQGAKVDLPAEQYPTATSFDGSADIMVSKKFTVTGTNPTVDDLQFARLGAIVKIVLDDSEDVMTSQHPSTVSMTAANPLAGRVLVNMQEQSMGDPYYNASTTVTANYTAGTKYEINGANATYLIVVPQTLAAGSTLTIAASTEGYSIEKEIILASDITLEAGKITTLNITLTSSHISASSGLALPFNDDFSWQTGSTNSTAVTFASDPGIPAAKYSAQNKVYQGNSAGEIKFGTSSAIGYLTTVELDLSSAFYVHLNAKNFNATPCTMEISVDDGAPQSVVLTGSYADYYFNFAAATNKSKVKIATTTSGYRSYVQQFDVISGAYVFPPVINVTSDNPMAVANTASSQTITYTISNPTAATLTAALQDPLDTWISNIDYSTDGEVTFDVAAQGSGDPARSAVIVLSYTGATDVEVTVNQAAGAGGATTKTLTITSGDVVSASGYAKYEITNWIITFGGNNKSVGTNSGNRANCNLSNYSKYAVSPVTTSSVASAFASKVSLSNVKKVNYTFGGGSNQTATKVYLLYSSDGTTFSQISLTSGTQGATIANDTDLEFAMCSGYFAVLFEATNASGNWRIDDVTLTFTYEE